MGVFCFRALIHLFSQRGYQTNALSVTKAWLPFACLALLSATYSAESWLTFQRALSGFFVLVGFGLGIPVFFTRADKRDRVIRQVSVVMGVAVIGGSTPAGQVAP